QMNAYRDQYAQLFGNDNGVKVLAISADPDTMTAGWAKEANYPVTFVSDTGRVLGPLYNTLPPPRAGSTARPLYSRVLFVGGRGGKLAHVMRPFRELVEDSYDQLQDGVGAERKQ